MDIELGGDDDELGNGLGCDKLDGELRSGLGGGELGGGNKLG